MQATLRRATPLVLLGLAAVAWFEPNLPGRRALESTFGAGAVHRFVTGVLCLYMVVLVLERQRLEQAFKQVLAAFKDFHAAAGATAAGRPGGTADAGADAGAGPHQARDEAVRILVGVLDSPDAALRLSAVNHLQRLTGQELGDDVGAWRRWLDGGSGS